MMSVRVPATTANLGPGYDSFGAAVSLYLGARAVPRQDRPGRVTSAGEGEGELPEDDGNLLWRAFLALCAHAGVEVPDIAVEVDNAIPLERGLGSSSAAIVAGLALARAVCDIRCSDLELVRLAADIEGHPDNVAPAILGGLVVCAASDHGELVVRRAQPHARLRPVVLVPAARQVTTAARGVLPATLGKEQVATQAARAGHVLGALLGAWPAAPDVSGDVLHEPARFDVMGPSGVVVAALREVGVHAWLSGAGPSVCAAAAVTDGSIGTCRRIGAANGFDVRALRWDLGGVLARLHDAP